MRASGYREDIKESEGSGEPKGVFPYLSLALFALLLLLQILSWITERGGIFSIISALASVRSKAAVVDIDTGGLWFPFTMLAWLVAAGVWRLLDMDLSLSTRAKTLLSVLVLMSGGLGLDLAFGESIITHYMASHGYSRCEAGDWARGNGKSRVWFADYVLVGVDCRKRVETVPDRGRFSWIRNR